MKHICLGLVLLTGCSFFLTRGPRPTEHPPRAAPECTTSTTYPALDSAVAGLFLISMTIVIFTDDDDDDSPQLFDEPSRAQRITANAVLAGLAGLSAYVGFSRVGRCRAAHESIRAAERSGSPPHGADPGPAPAPAPTPAPPAPAEREDSSTDHEHGRRPGV